MRRIFADVLLFASLLVLPWWVTLLLGGAFFFVFNSYYELLAVALLSDIMYASPISSLGGFVALHTAVVAVLYIFLFLIKKQVRV